MQVNVRLIINGKPTDAAVAADTSLVSYLRETLRLTGTHVGCDTASCGACTVLLDGHAVKSCNVLVAQLGDREVTTIEGIAPADGTLHPMQQAFKSCHGLQCGYCTPGMVMSAIDLVKNHPHRSESEIRAQLDGNYCRCTGYESIVLAIQEGAKAMGY